MSVSMNRYRPTGPEVVESRNGATRRAAWRRWLPWEGRATWADRTLLLSIVVVLALGVALRPLVPFLIAQNPVLLEIATGNLVAVGAAAAFARVGEVPLWAAVAAGAIGMIKFDWLTWWAGRQWGEGIVRVISTPHQARRWSQRAQLANPMVIRGAVVLAMVPGVPTAIVFAMAGMTGMRFMTFLLLDACGALAMTGLVSGLGYTLGQTAVDMVLLIDRYASIVSLSLIALLVTIPLIRRVLKRGLGRSARTGSGTAAHPPSSAASQTAARREVSNPVQGSPTGWRSSNYRTPTSSRSRMGGPS